MIKNSPICQLSDLLPLASLVRFSALFVFREEVPSHLIIRLPPLTRTSLSLCPDLMNNNSLLLPSATQQCPRKTTERSQLARSRSQRW